MELKCFLLAVVTTHRTLTAGLRHQDRLDLSPALDDPLGATPLAAVVAASLDDEVRVPVPLAVPPNGRQAGVLPCLGQPGRTRAATVPGPQPMPPEPIAHSG